MIFPDNKKEKRCYIKRAQVKHVSQYEIKFIVHPAILAEEPAIQGCETKGETTFALIHRLFHSASLHLSNHQFNGSNTRHPLQYRYF
jgi:hypothetical protein